MGRHAARGSVAGQVSGSHAGRFPGGPLLRHIAQLADPGIKAEEVLRFSGARIAYCDEILLAHDFPELGERELMRRVPSLAQMTAGERRAAIRRIRHDWVIRNASVISTLQAGQTRVNTPIVTTGESVLAWRPPRYGRSLVSSIANTEQPDDPASIYRGYSAPTGLLDLKGAGAEQGYPPHLGPHGSGLCSLYRLLSDLCVQWLFDEIFGRAAPGFWTVPVYAILDLGFDLRESPPTPAGMQIRRAHRRPVGGIELPNFGSQEEALKLEIESLARRYGLSSATWGTATHLWREGGLINGSLGPFPMGTLSSREALWLNAIARGVPGRMRIDGLNVQLTRDLDSPWARAQVVDFGHYHARDSFDYPLASLVRDRPGRLGHVCWPDDPGFIRPDPRIRFTADRFGYDEMSAWAREIAHCFRRGECSGDDLADTLRERLRCATANWTADS